MTTTQAKRDAAVEELLTRHDRAGISALAEAIDEVIYQATKTEHRMDPEIKAEWVRRLRSGDYDQGNGMLRTKNDEYCCLGVLCDVVQPDGWYRYKTHWLHGDVGASTMPSANVLIMAGASAHDPANPDALTSSLQNLAGVNDYGGTFALIADLIEEYL